MEEKFRYVWLNLEDGKFSNSWDQETHDIHNPQVDFDFSDEKYKSWKLIKYSCLNDENFEFYNQMKLK